MRLMEHQQTAVKELGNGKILHGGVGSGKSATTLGYYVEKESPRRIIVITTAKKRDTLDWEREASRFGIARDVSVHGTITVDSWNNIAKYLGVVDAFFIFDEQRLVGNGAWVKSFLKIAKKNHWVMLSATPGDTWMDYAPVFIANGFYKNITDFKFKHVVYEPFTKYPKIKMYLGERKLELLRNEILVEMPYIRHTKRFVNWMDVDYDKDLFKKIVDKRWNPYEEKPIRDVAEMFRLMRRAVNSDPSRVEMVRKLLKSHPRLIVFYNFDYELELLRMLADEFDVYEWNGHVKDDVPSDPEWVYLVQYVAGAEAWECTETDAMCLYSLTYSYRNFEQAQGRIDRMHTPFTELFYYVLLSNSVIDRGIRRSLDRKEDFNQRKFIDLMEHERTFSDPF